MKDLNEKHLMLCISAVALLIAIVEPNAHALTKDEINCGIISTYHEARGLSPEHWDRVFKVAVNRTKNPKKYGAKSANLCAIVHSRQYSTHRKRRIKEPALLLKIANRIKQGYWEHAGNYAYFHSRRGRMYYRRS